MRTKIFLLGCILIISITSPGCTRVIVSKQGVPALCLMLKDDDARVRAKAAEILANLGEDSSGAVPALVEALGDKDNDVRWKVSSALIAVGDDASPALIEVFREGNPIRMIDAFYILEKYGEGAIPYLTEGLKDDDPDVRLKCSEAIERIRSDIPDLVRIARKGTECGMKETLNIILEMNDAALDYLPFVFDCLACPGCEDQVALIFKEIDPEKAVPLLEDIFFNGENELKRSALVCLCTFGEDAEPVFMKAVESEDYEMHCLGLEGLHGLNSQALDVRVIRLILKDKPAGASYLGITDFEVSLLARCVPPPEMVMITYECVGDATVKCECHVATAYSDFEMRNQLFDIFTFALFSPVYPKRRAAAAKALYKFGPDAVSWLQGVLEDLDFNVRGAAMLSLKRLGKFASPALPILRQRAESVTYEAERFEILTTIRIIETAIALDEEQNAGD